MAGAGRQEASLSIELFVVTRYAQECCARAHLRRKRTSWKSTSCVLGGRNLQHQVALALAIDQPCSEQILFRGIGEDDTDHLPRWPLAAFALASRLRPSRLISLVLSA